MAEPKRDEAGLPDSLGAPNNGEALGLLVSFEPSLEVSVALGAPKMLLVAGADSGFCPNREPEVPVAEANIFPPADVLLPNLIGELGVHVAFRGC